MTYPGAMQPGRRVRNDPGVAQSPKEALVRYRKAAAKENSAAQERVAELEATQSPAEITTEHCANCRRAHEAPDGTALRPCGDTKQPLLRNGLSNEVLEGAGLAYENLL